MKQKKISNFEQDMKDLEDIVALMSEGNITLEQSVEFFEKGMKLSKSCSEKLNKAEQVIQKIVHSSKNTQDLELEKVTFESKK